MTVLQDGEERDGLEYYDMGEYGAFHFSTQTGSKQFAFSVTDIEKIRSERYGLLYNGDRFAEVTDGGRITMEAFPDGELQSLEVDVYYKAINHMIDTIKSERNSW